MARTNPELLFNGAAPASWQPWVAVASLLVSAAAAWWLLRIVALSALPQSPIPRRVKTGTIAGLVAVAVLGYTPLWRFGLLEATGQVESCRVVAGEKRFRRITPRRYRRSYCEARVETRRREPWIAPLRAEACDRLVREPIAVPFVVSSLSRLVKQPGRHAHLDLGWLALTSIASFTLVLIGIVATRRRIGRTDLGTELRFRLRRWLSKPRPSAPLHPDTLQVVRARWSAVRFDHRYEAELPADQRFLDFQLFGARPGEAIEVAFLPIGADGLADPNFADRFWMGFRDEHGVGRRPDDKVAGPIRLL